MGPDYPIQTNRNSLLGFAEDLQQELKSTRSSEPEEGTVVRFTDGTNMQGDKIYRVAVFYSGLWAVTHSSSEAVTKTHKAFIQHLSSSDHTEVTVMTPTYKVTK